MAALLVEDEALIALAVQDLLEAEGFETVVAYTEADAKSQVLEGLSVAIVNLSLHGKPSGKGIVWHLRNCVPNLPIVVVTAYEPAAPEADLRGLGGPMVRFLKPDGFSSLVTAIREVIEAGRRGPKPHPKRRREDRV